MLDLPASRRLIPAVRRLLVSFARIGDLVMLTPMLRRLGADADLHLACRPWGHDLLDEQGLLRGIHALEHPNHGTWSELLRGRPRNALGRTLAGIGFDEVVIFANERPVIRTWLARWLPQARLVELRPSNQGYVPESYAAALEAAGYAGGYRAIPLLTVTPERRAAATQRLAALGKRVVLIQSGSSSTHRLISRPNLRSLSNPQWAEVIVRLLGEQHADAVALLGSPLERGGCTAIARLIPETMRQRVAVWAGEAPIRDQPALAAAAHGMISVDTGPAHIAAAVACPLLMVFGPSIPERWCPRGDGAIERVIGPAPCGPCQGTPRMGACRANICLTRLPAATLIDGWRRLMAAAGR